MDVRFDGAVTQELNFLAREINRDRTDVVTNAIRLYSLVVRELSGQSIDNAVLAIVPRKIVSEGKIIKVPGVDTRF